PHFHLSCRPWRDRGRKNAPRCAGDPRPPTSVRPIGSLPDANLLTAGAFEDFRGLPGLPRAIAGSHVPETRDTVGRRGPRAARRTGAERHRASSHDDPTVSHRRTVGTPA